jgi:hypothetical protein
LLHRGLTLGRLLASRLLSLHCCLLTDNTLLPAHLPLPSAPLLSALTALLKRHFRWLSLWRLWLRLPLLTLLLLLSQLLLGRGRRLLLARGSALLFHLGLLLRLLNLLLPLRFALLFDLLALSRLLTGRTGGLFLALGPALLLHLLP